ncbi:hypothetical protein MN0502_14280 [Arthrobacter sp. MN05-02]|nr:hypothetical protein MN0502_14280 [Arthrobacter sp. MN05-02]
MSKADDAARTAGLHETDRPAPGAPDSEISARNRAALTALRALAGHQAALLEGVRVELPTRRQLRLQRSQGRAVAPTDGGGSAVAVDPSVRPDAADRAIGYGASVAGRSTEPLPGGRRDRRRQQKAQADDGVRRPLTDAAPRDPDAHRVEDMSIEEALATRNALIEDAAAHAAGLQAAATDDPFSVDPAMLARQQALAERAAALNARARQVQEVPEQDQQQPSVTHDPTAAHNLSFVAPPEVVRIPGSTRAVLRAPSTSLIPVVIPRPQRTPATGGGPDGGSPDDGRTEPIRAGSAFGLEPLDAMTAGLGRLRRLRYIQYSLLGVGAAALVTGIIMTVSSLNG